MATYGPAYLPGFFSGDAEFRTWVTGIHAMLASLPDITQTADSGQINPATVNRPAATDTAAGYEIWRLNDALQATVPIFLKLEYAVGTVVNRPSLFVTLGTGSNGAGALVNPGTRVQLFPNVSAKAGELRACFASCEAGRVDFCVNTDFVTALTGMFVHLERARDVTGAATADGAVLATSTGSSNGQVSAYNPTMGMQASNVQGRLLPGFVTPIVGWSKVASDSVVAPPVWYAGKPVYGRGVIVVEPGMQILTTIVAEVLGAMHPYLVIANAATGLSVGSAASERHALLWE